ncbi:MAG TPA: hypothetical protein VG994_07170 [Steroidobacteraceae bacterium]|nr:hypothetical protein [Steroidobacteraceae bacterium]
MPWEFERDEAFEKALRDLKKRFPNVEKDVLAEFESGPPQYTDPLPKFQRKLWKGRAASRDARRGKSGGFRVIYYWDEESPNWACIGTCYFKGDFANLPEHELNRLFISVKARYEQFMERERLKQAEPTHENTQD